MCRFGAICFPRRISATTMRSRYDEFTEEPTATCVTGVPSTSRTGTTLSGEWGLAMSGSICERSSVISSS